MLSVEVCVRSFPFFRRIQTDWTSFAGAAPAQWSIVPGADLCRREVPWLSGDFLFLCAIDLPLTLARAHIREFPRSDVLNRTTEPDNCAARIPHRFATGEHPLCCSPEPLESPYQVRKVFRLCRTPDRMLKLRPTFRGEQAGEFHKGKVGGNFRIKAMQPVKPLLTTSPCPTVHPIASFLARPNAGLP